MELKQLTKVFFALYTGTIIERFIFILFLYFSFIIILTICFSKTINDRKFPNEATFVTCRLMG
jgi:hypothetical protein